MNQTSHRLLGHINYVYLQRVSKENLLSGFKKINGRETKPEVRVQGKLTRTTFNRVIESTTRILEMIHVN